MDWMRQGLVDDGIIPYLAKVRYPYYRQFKGHHQLLGVSILSFLYDKTLRCAILKLCFKGTRPGALNETELCSKPGRRKTSLYNFVTASVFARRIQK